MNAPKTKSGKSKSATAVAMLPICRVQTVPPLETVTLFDSANNEPVLSALDQYLAATDELNKLIPPPPAVHHAHLGHLVLLGYMSAVESFFRTMIRRVINIDDVAQQKVHGRDITYAAAMHHTNQALLPEALFEKTSFSSRKNIMTALLEFLDIKDLPNDAKMSLDEFAKVCELRHCLVHRFGKLGSRNAIELGLKTHSKLFEKPLAVPYARLQDAFGVLHQTVRIINNAVFQAIVGRIDNWSWSLARDRRRFRMYYSVFATEKDMPPSPPADDCYRALRRRKQS